MAERSVEEVVQEAEQVQGQANDLMEKIARQELRSTLAARGLNPSALTDAELDTFAEGIAGLADDR